MSLRRILSSMMGNVEKDFNNEFEGYYFMGLGISEVNKSLNCYIEFFKGLSKSYETRISFEIIKDAITDKSGYCSCKLDSDYSALSDNGSYISEKLFNLVRKVVYFLTKNVKEEINYISIEREPKYLLDYKLCYSNGRINYSEGTGDLSIAKSFIKTDVFSSEFNKLAENVHILLNTRKEGHRDSEKSDVTYTTLKNCSKSKAEKGKLYLLKNGCGLGTYDYFTAGTRVLVTDVINNTISIDIQGEVFKVVGEDMYNSGHSYAMYSASKKSTIEEDELNKEGLVLIEDFYKELQNYLKKNCNFL